MFHLFFQHRITEEDSLPSLDDGRSFCMFLCILDVCLSAGWVRSSGISPPVLTGFLPPPPIQLVAEVFPLLRMGSNQDKFKCVDFLVLFGHSSHPVSTSCQISSFILWWSVMFFPTLEESSSVYSKYYQNWWVSDNSKHIFFTATSLSAMDRRKSWHRCVT